MGKISESTAYLYARIKALEKCQALLSFITATINEFDRFYTSDAQYNKCVEELRMRIQAEQGKTWNDLAMWAPFDAKAQALVKKKLEMYIDGKVNWSMEHLLPYHLRNSISGQDELREELRKALMDPIEEPKTTTVEVPIRAIDQNL